MVDENYKVIDKGFEMCVDHKKNIVDAFLQTCRHILFGNREFRKVVCVDDFSIVDSTNPAFFFGKILQLISLNKSSGLVDSTIEKSSTQTTSRLPQFRNKVCRRVCKNTTTMFFSRRRTFQNLRRSLCNFRRPLFNL